MRAPGPFVLFFWGLSVIHPPDRPRALPEVSSRFSADAQPSAGFQSAPPAQPDTCKNCEVRRSEGGHRFLLFAVSCIPAGRRETAPPYNSATTNGGLRTA